MPIIKPSFSVPDWVPLIGGHWGPFWNTNLGKSEKKQLFILFVVSLVLIGIFGALAYTTQKDSTETTAEEETDEPVYSFFIGLFAGIVFGLIDNAGLWFGMDALDPIFDPAKIPWVYGYGGRRQFSGMTDSDECVYYGAEFKDGKLSHGERFGERTPEEICGKTRDEYFRVMEMVSRSNMDAKERHKKLDNIVTNERAYADPKSEVFLGANLTKAEFFGRFEKYSINEKAYTNQINVYRQYLNHQYPSTEEEAKRIGSITEAQAARKYKLKDQLAKYKAFKSKYFGTPSTEDRQKVNEIEEELKYLQVWPGKNKKLARASLNGYTFGSLTNAGLGNTYSDLLGSFLSSFILILLINLTNVSNFSIITETLGIFIGCLLGVALPRTLLHKLSYKT